MAARLITTGLTRSPEGFALFVPLDTTVVVLPLVLVVILTPGVDGIGGNVTAVNSGKGMAVVVLAVVVLAVVGVVAAGGAPGGGAGVAGAGAGAAGAGAGAAAGAGAGAGAGGGAGGLEKGNEEVKGKPGGKELPPTLLAALTLPIPLLLTWTLPLTTFCLLPFPAAGLLVCLFWI